MSWSRASCRFARPIGRIVPSSGLCHRPPQLLSGGARRPESLSACRRPYRPLARAPFDVGPAAAEGRPPTSVSIAWRISARRSRPASGAGARPSTFTEPPIQPSTAFMVGAQELEPVLQVRAAYRPANPDSIPSEQVPQGQGGALKLVAKWSPTHLKHHAL